MSKESFMLVSLKDDKAKKLTQILSNPTARKILDYLSEKEGSESQISKALSIPLSTIHYNLKLLKQTKLVEVEEFHYSSKGKEVDHYKIANKYIIITPKQDSGFMDKLKTLLPSIVIFGAGVSLWQTLGTTTAQFADAAPLAIESAVALSAPVANGLAPPVWPVFVFGAAIFIGLYLIVDWFRKKFL